MPRTTVTAPHTPTTRERGPAGTALLNRTHVPDREHALVLLDPSSAAGERGLDYALAQLQPTASKITLFMALTGSTALPLRGFAGVDESFAHHASDAYVDRLRRRTEQAGRRALVESSLGQNLIADVVDYGTQFRVGSIVVPASVARLDPMFVPRVATLLDIPVIVVPANP